MGSRGALAAALLGGLALVSGCAAIEPQPVAPAASAVGAPSPVTTAPADARKKALLKALIHERDVPGSKELAGSGTAGSTSSPSDVEDVSACASLARAGGGSPGAPDPSEVDGPEIELVMGSTTHIYTSSATEGPPAEVASGITEFTSPAASECFLGMMKKMASDDGMDASAMTATGGELDIADGGALISIQGPFSAHGRSLTMGLDFVAFQKGSTFVMVTATTIRGNSVDGMAEALARKVADRLP